MASSNSTTATSSVRRRRGGFFKKNALPASKEQLKQQAIEKHLTCQICTKIPYPGSDALVAAAEAAGTATAPPPNNGGAADNFDAGLYAYINQMNTQTQFSENNATDDRVDEATAMKTRDRCARHAQKLRNSLCTTTVATATTATPPTQNLLGSKKSRYPITSPMSQHDLEDQAIAPFDIKEIRLGSLLGMGGFSVVHEVASFHPVRELSERLSIHERNCRDYLADNIMGSLESNDSRYCRYAIKHLKKALIEDPEKFERAAIDLVLEAQLLMALNHPHIVALRGWSSQGVNGLLSGRHDSFFIIIDRLSETLENRIFRWRVDIGKHRTRLRRPWSRQKCIDNLDAIQLDRLQVIRDIASAVEYMHERRIIYRDLKITNVGFDGGVLKLFDFGLTRVLPPASRTMEEDESFLMSRVGTKYYMAPEVRNKMPYNCSADVYSYGVCAWEIMALGSPREVLRKYKEDEHKNHASGGTSRTSHCPLPMCSCWPEEIRPMVTASLSIVPTFRPRMAQVRVGLETLMQRLGYQRRQVLDSCGGQRTTFHMDRTVVDHSSQATSEYGAGPLDNASQATSEYGAGTLDYASQATSEYGAGPPQREDSKLEVLSLEQDDHRSSEDAIGNQAAIRPTESDSESIQQEQSEAIALNDSYGLTSKSEGLNSKI